MEREFWKKIQAEELAPSREEVNRENRFALRLFSIAGLPLGLVIVLTQAILASDVSSVVFVCGFIGVILYFIALMLLDYFVVPKDYPHSTYLLYLAEVPVVIATILLGTVWDPNNQAVTFLVVLMAMPILVLGRPLRVSLNIAAWTVLFLVVAFFVKPFEVFECDLLHTLVFFAASVAVTNIVLRVRVISLRRLDVAKHHLEHDELTGLRNRRSLEQHAADYLGKPLTVVSAELDLLRMYNDFYGHSFGNQTLRIFATSMQKGFGYEDTYRRGDDVIGILLSDDEKDIRTIVGECRARLKGQKIEDKEASLTCAVGCVTGEPATTEELQQMIQLAGVFAHKAMRGGRDQTAEGSFDEKLFHDATLEGNIQSNANAYETNQLTGLPSMSYFITFSEELLGTVVDHSRKPVIGFIKLLHIKRFNNEFGYTQGDEMIRHAGHLLREAFPLRHLSCITGGEFAIMCYVDEIEPGLRMVREGLKNYKNNYTLNFSAGFAICEPEETVISLLDKARVAQRAADENDGLAYRFYDDQLDSDIRFSEYVVTHLDEAMKCGYLEVYYQPIVRAETGEKCEEEALSRWNGPECGMLLPGNFIPPLEESRQIYKLSLYVVRQVLKDLERRKREGIPIVPVSVNLSRCDFEQCDMVDEITRMVDASGFSRSLIRIEITESAFIKNQEVIKRETERFQERGFQVWMDDFGSEYSTLNMLQELSFDLIKLDMHFLNSNERSGRNMIIVSSIIDMAKKLGISTLVEGVESSEHLATLQEMGCDKMQGYLFGRPCPLGEQAQEVQPLAPV